jgi:hypothetical protein
MYRSFALTLALSALVVVNTTGCIQQAPEDHPVRKALPTSDNIRINLPEQNNQGAQQYALGQLADYYVITRNVTRDFNAGAAFVLILVHAIVQFPPTSVDGDTYTWGGDGTSGPLDPADYRLVVTDNLDGSYDWNLDGKSKLVAGAEFVTVIAGNAVQGREPHRGTGSFFIDFDAAEEVNPIDNDARGRVDVAYDLENTDGTQGFIDMHIETTELDENGVMQPVSADYHYAENADRSGDFQFAIHGDLDEDGGTMFEDATIRSRWLTDGSGRADIAISGGDLGDLDVTASECWDGSFGRVYYSDSMEWAPTEGDSADCAIADAAPPGA